MESFFENVADLLDTEQKIMPEMRLDSVGEWDSLTVVSFLAMVNVEYGKTMRVVDFAHAETFQDLYDIIMKK